ncbi:MAG TPA: hypothetical protein PKA64_13730, partial [Myxococcota bacterium]|nr:hypothetical protein [Myxococcota bacterium]
MRALVALLVLACGGDKPPGPPDDTDLTDTPDTDAPDTDAPGDPCDPDPCTGEPGTVCDGGFCSTSRVEVSGGDRAWQGQVTDLAAGVAWTFTTAPLGEGAQATLAAGGESLTVDVPDPAAMTLTWAGVTLDGAGPLTTEERAALDDLLATPG